MPGSIFKPELIKPFQKPENCLQIEAFIDTINFVEKNSSSIRAKAITNLQNWIKKVDAKASPEKISVSEQDWAAVTQQYTERHGKIFAVLNMASAIHPGSNVVKGGKSQEADMFIRSDCFRFVTDEDTLPISKQNPIPTYLPKLQHMINGEIDNTTYLELAKNYRVCIKGPEDTKYTLLDEDRYFPFFEMRSASTTATKTASDEKGLQQRIHAQIDTLVKEKIRHVVFGPFGHDQGHDLDMIARIYQNELAKNLNQFDHIVFALPTLNPDQRAQFHKILSAATQANKQSNGAAEKDQKESQTLSIAKKLHKNFTAISFFITHHRILLADPTQISLLNDNLKSYIDIIDDRRKLDASLPMVLYMALWSIEEILTEFPNKETSNSYQYLVEHLKKWNMQDPNRATNSTYKKAVTISPTKLVEFYVDLPNHVCAVSLAMKTSDYRAIVNEASKCADIIFQLTAANIPLNAEQIQIMQYAISFVEINRPGYLQQEINLIKNKCSTCFPDYNKKPTPAKSEASITLSKPMLDQSTSPTATTSASAGPSFFDAKAVPPADTTEPNPLINANAVDDSFPKAYSITLASLFKAQENPSPETINTFRKDLDLYLKILDAWEMHKKTIKDPDGLVMAFHTLALDYLQSLHDDADLQLIAKLIFETESEGSYAKILVKQP